jgi:hypothetical protein
MKINYVVGQSETRFKIKKGEQLDLVKLQKDCLSHGIVAKTGKGTLHVRLNNVSFSLHSNGRIGSCYGKSLVDFDGITAHFFWQNFAINCIKKKEMV